MAYYVKKRVLPTGNPLYSNSDVLVNPLCKTSGATTNIATHYSDENSSVYITNPLPAFLSGADGLFEQNDVGLLYAGYGLGLEKSLYTYSIGADLTTTSTGTFTVQKNSDYGYDVLVNGSTATTRMSKIAPIIYFEITGGGGGGSGSHDNTIYGSGGGGGGGCIRGLIDLSKVSNIYYQVGIGGAGGDKGTSGSNGDSSWISVTSTSDRLRARGGYGGTVYTNSGAGGKGGDGGICYREYNGQNITPGGLTSGGYQTGLYVLAVANGGAGGNGARGDENPATTGKGTSIAAYSLAGKTIVHGSTTSNTSLVTPHGIDVSNYGGWIAGGGGSSAVGQGGCPGMVYGIYNSTLYDGQDPGAGTFSGGGGGGACCSSPGNDYYIGAKGANGRLQIKFAYMPEP